MPRVAPDRAVAPRLAPGAVNALPLGYVVSVEETSVRPRRFRVGALVLAALLVGMAAVLPFALRSVVEEIAEPPEGQVFPLSIAPGVPLAPDHSRLHVSLIDLDEARLLVTLRVSGHHVCSDRCTDTERIIFF